MLDLQFRFRPIHNGRIALLLLLRRFLQSLLISRNCPSRIRIESLLTSLAAYVVRLSLVTHFDRAKASSHDALPLASVAAGQSSPHTRQPDFRQSAVRALRCRLLLKQHRETNIADDANGASRLRQRIGR